MAQMTSELHKKMFGLLDRSQQDLMKLHHAAKCNKGSACVVPGCAMFKGIFVHMGTRDAPRCTGCDVPRCRELNGYVAHFRSCADQAACPYCSGLLKIHFKRKLLESEPKSLEPKRARAEVDAADALASLALP